MSMLGPNFTAPVLRNKGVPVHMIKVDAEGIHVTKHMVDEESMEEYEEPVIEIAYLRITNNVLADLEEIYGSTEKFEQAIDEHPANAIRTVYGLAFDGSALSQLAFSRIPPQGMPEAAVAVTTAFGLASGMDPQQAVTLHRKGLELARMAQERLQIAIAKALDEALVEENPSPEASPTSPPSSEPTSTPTLSSEQPGNSPSPSEPETETLTVAV
jgi:hypothetical protein